MSVTSLKKEIQSAQKNKILSQAEVKKIEASVAPTVTDAEARVIADLYEKTQHKTRAIGKGGSPLVVTPAELKVGAKAMSMLQAFIVRAELPIGENRGVLKEKLSAIFDRDVNFDAPLGKAPRGARNMVKLPLWDESQPAPGPWDGLNKTAYIHAAKSEFYVHTNMTRGRPEQFYGPFAIE
jgi:hypothetical protein